MKKKWWALSVLGLLLCGFGLSLLGEAIIFKSINDYKYSGLKKKFSETFSLNLLFKKK